MAEHSKIEWTDSSWSPIRAHVATPHGPRVGWHCEHVSEACRNCYAEKINLRLGTGFEFKPGHLRRKTEPHGDWRGDVTPFLDEKMLEAPLRWRKPRKIFVCSMTDLFASFVPDEWIDRVFAVMALAPHHQFQVLTKRPERAREYLGTRAGDWMIRWPDAIPAGSMRMSRYEVASRLGSHGPTAAALYHHAQSIPTYPLPNVWLGTSVEDQATADERIPHLLATPAAIRFVSYEPALGPVDFARLLDDGDNHFDALQGSWFHRRASGAWDIGIEVASLSWVIAGGESGPGARPAHPDWFRRVRDDCAAAGVAFLFKQVGHWHASRDHEPSTCKATEHLAIHIDGRTESRPMEAFSLLHTPGWEHMCAVGKKAAGRELDGVEHNEFPA